MSKDESSGSIAQASSQLEVGEMVGEEKHLPPGHTEMPGHDVDIQRLGGVGAQDGARYLAGLKLFSAMTSITLLILLTMLDISIIGTAASSIQAVPQITSDFHSLQDISWYSGAYQLASATVQPLTGKIYTYFSIKVWTLLVFVLIFEIGSAICGAAQSSPMLIIGRAIAGLGCSGLMNGCLTLIFGAITPEKRTLYTSIAMGVGQIGIVFGPFLGGIFTEHASWRWCFYINLPLGGLAALLIVVIAIPDQIQKEPASLSLLAKLIPDFDLFGFALLASASLMLLLGLQFGANDYSWNSATVIGLLCGSALSVGLFIAWERRVGGKAMIPLRILSQTTIWTSCLHYAFLIAVTTGGGYFLPIYLQSVKGLSPTMSAVYMLPTILLSVVYVIFSGALMPKLGYYIPWAAFASGGTAIGCGLISTWTTDSTIGQLMGYQVIFALRGLGMQMSTVAIQTALPPTEIAIVFQESLKANIKNETPSIDPAAALAAGGSAEAVRALAPDGGELLRSVLNVYSKSVGNVYYLLIGACVVSLAASPGMGWVDVRKKKPTGRVPK
uniref:Major facilitator superfamily (MFS) profile domain-containing protein n=1 Tax=Bionectria ochroleuca TaxID=29856 RepID=A0A8H7N8L5_BIOOC